MGWRMLSKFWKMSNKFRKSWWIKWKLMKLPLCYKCMNFFTKYTLYHWNTQSSKWWIYLWQNNIKYSLFLSTIFLQKTFLLQHKMWNGEVQYNSWKYASASFLQFTKRMALWLFTTVTVETKLIIKFEKTRRKWRCESVYTNQTWK